MWLVLALLACGGGETADEADAHKVHETGDPAVVEGGHHADGHGHGHGHGHGDGAKMHHDFSDASKWSEIFDDPKRAAWQKPDAVVAAMSIDAGMSVADIGAGTGYLNSKLAEAVGAEGKVIAVDIEQTLIDHMTERAEREGTPQVEARLGKPDDPGLAESEVDRIVLLDVYHHIGEREAYFGALLHAVKPGGQLIIVDFKPGELPVGPPPEGKIPPDQVTAELTAAGWALKNSSELVHQFVHVYEVGAG